MSEADKMFQELGYKKHESEILVMIEVGEYVRTKTKGIKRIDTIFENFESGTSSVE